MQEVCETEHPYGVGGVQARYPPGMVALRVSRDRTRLLVLTEEVRADRDYNYGMKMVFEGCLREMEGRRRVKRGMVERLLGMR